MGARQTDDDFGGLGLRTAAGGYEVYENVIKVPSGYVVQEIITRLRNGVEYIDDVRW